MPPKGNPALKRAQLAVNKAGWNTRRRGGRYLKATTSKGAYKRNKVSKFVKRRRPLVECKSVTNRELAGLEIGGEVIPSTTDFKIWGTGTNMEFLVPYCYYVMTQGLDDWQMVGRDLFSKVLSMKLQFRFPQQGNMTQSPNEYKLVWGWIPAPINPTGNTNPAKNQYNATLIQAHVITRLGEYFEDRKDRLSWIPKGTHRIIIKGERKIRPDMRFNNSVPPQHDGVTANVYGTIPDFHTQISWKPMRKIHYPLCQPATKAGTYNAHALVEDWIPFAVLVNPDLKVGDTQLQTGSYAYNFNHYFTDS